MLAAALGGGFASAGERGLVGRRRQGNEGREVVDVLGRRRRRRRLRRSSAGSRSSRAAGRRAGFATSARSGSATRRRRARYLLLLTAALPELRSRARAAGLSRPAAAPGPRRRRRRPRRPRLTVFFRLFLAIPHFVWLALWTIAAFFAVDRELFVGARDRAARRMRCTASSPPTSATATHVVAFVTSSRTRSRASRAARATRSTSCSTRPSIRTAGSRLFRFFLAIPAFIVASALSVVLSSSRSSAGATRS